MSRLLIVFLSFSYTWLNAQDWELFVIEKEDTSLTAVEIIELDFDNLFLVTESFLFYPNSVGVFTSGFPKYGLDLITFDQDHQVDNTNFIPLGSKYTIGSLLNFDDVIIVPIEVFTGIELCYSPFGSSLAGSQATDLGLLKFDTNVSELLEDTLYLHRDTSVCGTLDFVQFANCQNILYSLRYNSNKSKLLFELIDAQNLEILKAQYIDIDVQPVLAYFDCEDQTFLIYCDFGDNRILCKMDFDGNVLWNKDGLGEIIEIEATFEKDFYWLKTITYDYESQRYTTFLYKIGKQGNLLTSWDFDNHNFVDIESIGQGMLLALENGENELSLHIINEIGRIVSTESFIYERALGRSLKLLSNEEVIIIADKVDAYNVGVCCIEVGENSPNKVLVIKRPLKEIWNPKVSENEEVIVFPNPTTNKIEIIFKEYYFNLEDTFYYQLHSLNGQILQESEIFAPSQVVSLSALPKSVYFLSIYQEDKVIKTKKIIKN